MDIETAVAGVTLELGDPYYLLCKAQDTQDWWDIVKGIDIVCERYAIFWPKHDEIRRRYLNGIHVYYDVARLATKIMRVRGNMEEGVYLEDVYIHDVPPQLRGPMRDPGWTKIG